MSRGRSLQEYERVYIGGYDLSAYISETGERGVEHSENESKCLSDLATGYLAGKPKVTVGPFNGVFDNTATSGLHVLADAAKGTVQYITVTRGVVAVPAIGDDAFCVPAYQTKYTATGKGTVTATVGFAGPDASLGLNYGVFFGALLHPFGNETATNSANTNADNGASSALGGWLMYHIKTITGSGTVTISVDDAANSTGPWAALSGATTGAIATATAPTAGFIQLATNATVRQYLRWQIAFGGSASGCNFALSFVRGG